MTENRGSFFGTDASEIKRPISEEKKTLLARMDTVTACHFSRNRALDFLRPAIRRGGGVLAPWGSVAICSTGGGFSSEISL